MQGTWVVWVLSLGLSVAVAGCGDGDGDGGGGLDAGEDASMSGDGTVPDSDGGGGLDGSTDSGASDGAADASDASTGEPCTTADDCDSTPEADCADGKTARTYKPSATCNEDGFCEYDTDTLTRCSGGDLCKDGACEPQCAEGPPSHNISDDDTGSSGPRLASTAEASFVSGATFRRFLVWLDVPEEGGFRLPMAEIGDDGSRSGDKGWFTDSTWVGYQPGIAWNGTDFGAAWTDVRDPEMDGGTSSNNIWFKRFDDSGATKGTEVQITDHGHIDFAPDVAWNPLDEEFLVIWEEDPAGPLHISRLDEAGTIIEDDTALDTSGNDPRIIWNPEQEEYALVYSDAGVSFRTLARDGTPGPVKEVVNDTGRQLKPEITWTGTHYGVTWADERRHPAAKNNADIYFRRLDAAGDPVGSELPIAEPEDDARFADVIWTGNYYSIAWGDPRSGGEVYMVELDADGTMIGSPSPVTCGDAGADTPELIWENGRHGLAYRQDEADDIFFKFLAPR